MPTVSKKQERFMQAVAHNPAFAKKVGVPVKVGKEFTKSGGGDMKESKAMVKKEVSFMKKKGAPKSMIKHEMAEAGMKRRGMTKYAEGGMTDKEITRKTPEDVARINASRAYHKGPKAQEAFQSQMKNESPELKDVARKALQKEYKAPRGGGGSGGSPSSAREMQLGSELDPKAMMKREGMKYGGKVKKMAAGGMAASKMGSVKTAAPSRDGVAVKGKTQGAMVKMAGSTGMKKGGATKMRKGGYC
jgi:hypothetical protein